MFKIFKKDDIKLGLLWGFIGPFFGLFGYYLLKARSAGSFIDFIKYLGWQQLVINNMLIISLLANIVLFTLYINNHIDKTAKGIFIITVVYAIAGFVLKLAYAPA